MYSLAHRILKKLNPETAHNLSIQGLKMGLYPKVNFKNINILEQTIWGRRFQTPIGLSAGFDKNAEVIKPILNLGFSFTELGTVTPLPQKGNPKPRIFRFPKHQALVNSLGFNNKGLDNFERNIVNSNTNENFQDKIIGINIGNNKETKEIIYDLEKLFDRLYRLGDYIVINLSSPNTPGLRDNLKSHSFEKIVNHLHKLRDKNNSKIKAEYIIMNGTKQDSIRYAEMLKGFATCRTQKNNVVLMQTIHGSFPSYIFVQKGKFKKVWNNDNFGVLAWDELVSSL